MTYTHRNGETESPAETGFFWFRGKLLDATNKPREQRRFSLYDFDKGPMHVYRNDHNPLFLLAQSGIVVYQLENMEGQWYGPIPEPDVLFTEGTHEQTGGAVAPE